MVCVLYGATSTVSAWLPTIAIVHVYVHVYTCTRGGGCGGYWGGCERLRPRVYSYEYIIYTLGYDEDHLPTTTLRMPICSAKVGLSLMHMRVCP